MKANTVFVHERFPSAALQTSFNDFFAIQTKFHEDIEVADEVTGHLALNKVKWFFNVTRGTLIQIKVLGRFQNLHSAIGAASLKAGYTGMKSYERGRLAR